MCYITRALAAVLAAFAVAPADAEQQLNVVCSVQLAWCEAVAKAFQRDTGIVTGVTQKFAGDAIAQIAADRANPRVDVWYAGPEAAHLVAAEQELTDEYRSPNLAQLHDWAVQHAQRTRFRSVAIYAAPVGIGYNAKVLKRKNLPEPKCWADLANPIYRHEITMADPSATDSAYVTLATYVQVFGEDRAFELLRSLHANTGSYLRTSSGAIRAVARGEVGIGIASFHEGVNEMVGGFPVQMIVPCEGAGFEIGSMSIVKGARNPDSAKRFYDWALTPEAQQIGADLRNFQMPSNKAVAALSGAPKFDEVRLIPFDVARFADPAERSRLLEKWSRDVRSTPR